MTVTARIEQITGQSVRSLRLLEGGDLGGAVQVTLADGTLLVAKDGPLVHVEAEMLRTICATGAPVPRIHHAEPGLLVMDYVAAGDLISWEALAETLAVLHAPLDPTGPRYGWDVDYAFGKVSIVNSASDDWPHFWAQHRLLCHVPHVSSDIATRLETLAVRLPDLLPTAPPVSLLHGDLWGGNMLFEKDRFAAFIDPASYRGDREVDVAMLAWVESPPPRFFDALDLSPGWRERYPVYALWPALVHLRLFGDGYRASVTAALDALGA